MVIELEKHFDLMKQNISKIITEEVNKHHFEVSPLLIENASIHLCLSLTRELNGTYIHTSHSQLENCKKEVAYPIAKDIIKRLSLEYDTDTSENDIFYTTLYLSDKSLLDLDFNIGYDIIDDDVEVLMDEVLDEIQQTLGYNLKEDNDFYKGMSLHFYPALERLKDNAQLTDNPVIPQENDDYIKANQCADILNDVVEKHYHKQFNKNELAYISLHFETVFYKEAA